MVFTLQLSRTAQKALDKLPPSAVKKIYHHLEEVARDPYRPRPKADIVPVAGSKTLYRLRVGKLKVEYEVRNDENNYKNSENISEEKKIGLQIKQYTNKGEDCAMAARSRTRVAKEEPLDDMDFAALDEEDESSAEELHSLIEREKDEFISFEEYAKRRGVRL